MKLHLAQWRFHKQQVTQVHCKNSSKWKGVLSTLSILGVFTVCLVSFSKSVSRKWLYPSANFLDCVHPSSSSDISLFLCAAEISLDVKLQEEGWHMLSSRQGLSGNSWPTLWCVWATVERSMNHCWKEYDYLWLLWRNRLLCFEELNEVLNSQHFLPWRSTSFVLIAFCYCPERNKQ